MDSSFSLPTPSTHLQVNLGRLLSFGMEDPGQVRRSCTYSDLVPGVCKQTAPLPITRAHGSNSQILSSSTRSAPDTAGQRKQSTGQSSIKRVATLSQLRNSFASIAIASRLGMLRYFWRVKVMA